MKKIISLVSVGVLSLALAAPVLADNQHDGKVRGAQPARFQHFRSFRGPFIQTYYHPYPSYVSYPYPSYVSYPYPVYYPDAVAQESPWVDPAPEVQREL